MGFRTIVIKNRCKLDLRMNYLVCRGEEEKRVYIPEISYLLLESTAISLTTALLSELLKNNVKIIFCDEKHNPESEVVSFYGNYNCVSKIKKQQAWSEQSKSETWKEIVQSKIKQQEFFLHEIGAVKEAELLKKYYEEVGLNDVTNREGHAAKVYFNAVFGKFFSRRDENVVNAALNYGYAILLSCFNREIVRQGYLTQIGIWHRNEFNYFNLSCDFMEPFRVLVDRLVYDFVCKKQEGGDFRIKLLEIFNLKLKIDGKSQFFENAISIYCQSLFDSLNYANQEVIKFYEL